MNALTETEYSSKLDASEGYCTACKAWTRDSGVEPDAEGKKCPECEGMTVMGAENALCHGDVDVAPLGKNEAPSPERLVAEAIMNPTPSAQDAAIDAICLKAVVCRDMFCRTCQAILDVRRSVLLTPVKNGQDVTPLVVCGECYDRTGDTAHRAMEARGVALRVHDPRKKTSTRATRAKKGG